MDLKHTMAAHVRRVRNRKKLTQEQLAERADLSMRYIGAIERADASPTVTVLGRLADALDVDPAELVTTRKA